MDIPKTLESNKNLMNLMIFLFYVTSFLFTIAKSEVITVGGDENRWTDGFNYLNWAENITFHVGDVLEFKYSKGAHNVYDVTRPTFQSCDTASGVNAKYESGDDHVELKEAKQYWFICTVDRHCQLGMKLGINVSESTTNSSANSATHNMTSKHMNTWFYLLAVAILSMLVTIV